MRRKFAIMTSVRLARMVLIFAMCFLLVDVQPAAAEKVPPLSGEYTGFVYSNGTYTTGLKPNPNSINNNDQLAGYSKSWNAGFLYDNGTYTTIQPSGWNNVHATGINNNGMIVGVGLTEPPETKPPWTSFIYSNGTYTTLNALSGYTRGVQINGVNDSNIAAGSLFNESGIATAFIYSNGTYTTLNFAPDSFVNDLNNDGYLVGWKRSGNTAFIYNYNTGTYTTIGSGRAVGINNNGEVVGYAGTGPDDYTGFIYNYNTGVLSTLDPPVGWNLVFPTDINDEGVIVGTLISRGGSPDPDPVPIPAAAWLLGTGLVGLVVIRRKFSK